MKEVLRRLVAGEIDEDEALAKIRAISLHELSGRARLDLGRHLRRGLPEVVLAAGKDPADAARLVIALAESQGQGLISRMTDAHRGALEAAALAAGMRLIPYHSSARVVREGWAADPVEGGLGKVGILTAGTSDVPVAEEARMVVEACGLEARLSADLGVAGLHRFVAPLAHQLEWGADVIIVAAGMDGILPGLVSGLIGVPVIGLPVSTGYGRGGGGEGALTTMLQSCSTGLVVVNIDNGVGAGAAAVLIAIRAAQGRLRGRSDAITAPTSAAKITKPKKTGTMDRHASGPPGMAKVRASTTTDTKTAAISHGKPRRRRP